MEPKEKQEILRLYEDYDNMRVLYEAFKRGMEEVDKELPGKKERLEARLKEEADKMENGEVARAVKGMIGAGEYQAAVKIIIEENWPGPAVYEEVKENGRD